MNPIPQMVAVFFGHQIHQRGAEQNEENREDSNRQINLPDLSWFRDIQRHGVFAAARCF